MGHRPRDPETGQFLPDDAARAGGPGYVNMDRISAKWTATIPAADLGGGNLLKNITGDAARMVDFSGVLENDEVFELHTLIWTASLTLPTTATAESYAEVSYDFSRDSNAVSGAGPPGVDPVFFGVSEDTSQGDYDVQRGDGSTPETLLQGHLTANGGFGDSTNGLGAGADEDRERRVIPYRQLFGQGPGFDRDDELYISHDTRLDNISDHAVVETFMATLHGVIHEV